MKQTNQNIAIYIYMYMTLIYNFYLLNNSRLNACGSGKGKDRAEGKREKSNVLLTSFKIQAERK